MLKKVNYILFVFSLLFASMCQAQSVKSIFFHANDPQMGSSKAPVTIVEFFDYQCSHCVRMVNILDDLIKSHKEVRVVFKDFPIRGGASEFAARAALAANKQHKYYVFNRALLSSRSHLTEQHILEIAKSVGLDITKLKKDMYSAAISNQLNGNIALAQALNINGTPAFIIGPSNATDDKKVDVVLGEMSKSEILQAINKAKNNS